MWDIFMKSVVFIAAIGLGSGLWYLRDDPNFMPQNRWDCYWVIIIILLALVINMLMGIHFHHTGF